MAEYREESALEYVFSLLQIRDFPNFFDRFQEVLENRTQECLSDTVRNRLITLFLNNNVGENQRKNQQLFIGTFASTITNLEDRLSFYQDMVNAIGKFQPNLKDQFLVDVFSIEQSLEIAQFVYSQSDPYGEAHYHTVFYFITGEIIPVPDISIPKPGPVVQLKTPRIQFAEQQEIQCIIPSQQLPDDVRDKEITCVVHTGTREPYQVSLEKHQQGKNIVTGVYTGTLPPCEETYQFSLWVNDSNLHTWEKIQGLSAVRPFLAFQDPSGNLIKDETLPRERTWIVSQYPILQEDGILQKGLLGGEWLSYYYYLINPLPHCDYYIQVSEDSVIRLPFAVVYRTPSLLGARLDEVIFDPPIPWYSQVPRLLIPYTIESENNSVKIEIFRNKSPHVSAIQNIELLGEQEYIQKDLTNRTYSIDLSHHDILGSSPVGEYTIKISNSETTLHFCIAPHLEVLFHPPVMCLSHRPQSAIEVEINGPTSIYPITPCNKIRDGLFEIPIPEDNEVLQSTRIQCNIGYDIKENYSPDFLKLSLELPLIRYSIQGLTKPQTIFTENDMDFFLREHLIDSLEIAKILVEKPRELIGAWKLCIGSQESWKYEIDDSGNLAFPLVTFRETLLEHYDQPLPVLLKYFSKRKTTDVTLFSLVDWTLEYKDVSFGFENGQYNISVTWRERGRTQKANISLFSGENEQISTDFQSEKIPVYPSKHRWRENTALFTVPFSVPQGPYTIGFIVDETDREGWAPGPSVRFPLPIQLTREPYAIATWLFTRKNYGECLSWLEKIPEDDSHYPDALILKAKCTACLAEKTSSIEKKKAVLQEALRLTDEAISIRSGHLESFITKAHLHNRIGFYDEGNSEHYQNAKTVLLQVLGQVPQELPAITEYGISLMGLRKTREAMKIFQFLRYLDPKDNQVATLWGKAMLLYQYSLRVKGRLGQRDTKKIVDLLAKARKLDEHNPLYESFAEEIQRANDTKPETSHFANTMGRETT